MDLLCGSFVSEVREPIRIADIRNSGPPEIRPISIQQELENFFRNGSGNNYRCRFISICQRTSWRPLQMTKSMATLLVSHHHLAPSFWDLASCFYTRHIELEEAYSTPLTQISDGSWIDITYSIRYPELKWDEDHHEWVARHSGIHHRYNMETQQSIIILLSPSPNSKMHAAAMEELLERRQNVIWDPSWIHRLLLSVHLPAWRQYITSLENKVLPIANTTFSTYIHEELRLGYDNLSMLVSQETLLLRATALLTSTKDTIIALSDVIPTLKGPETASDMMKKTVDGLQNSLRQCDSFLNTAKFLHQRAQITAQLLSDTLSLRDQVIAKEQNRNMLGLNKSAVFVTTLTLFYVPASFVATFFGMNFFGMDEQGGRMVATSMIWIYITSTIVLSAMTFIFYYWLLHHEGQLFQRLAPNVRMPVDWRALTRRFTGTNKAMLDRQNLATLG